MAKVFGYVRIEIFFFYLVSVHTDIILCYHAGHHVPTHTVYVQCSVQYVTS